MSECVVSSLFFGLSGIAWTCLFSARESFLLLLVLKHEKMQESTQQEGRRFSSRADVPREEKKKIWMFSFHSEKSWEVEGAETPQRDTGRGRERRKGTDVGDRGRRRRRRKEEEQAEEEEDGKISTAVWMDNSYATDHRQQCWEGGTRVQNRRSNSA